MVDVKINKDFGKVSPSKARIANAAIHKIAKSDKSIDQKAKAIALEFDKAYKRTGLDNLGTSQIRTFKKMLKAGHLPVVSDKNPLK